MNDTRLPLLIEPEQLLSAKESPDLVIVDLCKAETYAQAHIPGAIHIEYSHIVTSSPPVMGLVPDKDHLATLMSQSGIKPGDTLVAYDDEGGGKAARFIYTLDIIGHKKYALLNGGLHAWANEGHPLESSPNKKPPSEYAISISTSPVATKDYIQSHLGTSEVQVVDARSPEEYQGTKKFAARGGHIPGAINLDWVNLMNPQRNLRLKNSDELKEMLQTLGLSYDKPTVVYCQTHHRSALTYFALKNLGFTDVKGYPGSWSEWGNSTDTPIETGLN